MSEQHSAEKDADPWRCDECGARREAHIVGERDGTVRHAWSPILPPAGGGA